MAVQLRNDELVELLRGDFQMRYESNFGWKSLVSAMINLPGLRACWPMSAIRYNGNAHDYGGDDSQLTDNSTPLYGYDFLAPYVEFDGSNYLSRADEAQLDITGTETYVKSAFRGLTMGAWIYPELIGQQQCVLGKWHTGTNDRSYNIQLLALNTFQADISSAGTAGTILSVTSSVAVTADSWYYVSMSYDPSTRLAINVNGTIDEVTVGVPANVFSGAADFIIGACNNGALLRYTGRVSASWLCAMYHPDYWTEVLREQTRAIYRE